jgi:hypothetical protein
MRVYERIKEVKKDSWMYGGTKKRHGEPEQLLSTGSATWWLRATMEWRGMRGRRQRGSAEAVAGLPGDAWNGAGAGAGLGWRSNDDQRRCCCGSRENRGGRKGKKHPRVLSTIIGTIGTSL